MPDGVEIETSPGRITVKGPKGSLAQELSPDMSIARDGDRLVVSRPTDRADHRALHGLTRSLVANMVEGVTKGYEKRLEIQGVGYRATPKGSDIEFEAPGPTLVVVRGIDKQAVGQVAANIRGLKPPEPYKGKGIRYAGERVIRKVGKRA